MRRSAAKRKRDYSLPWLCRDVSEVLNRVRPAFGHIPMKAAAGRPGVRAAERRIEQAARLVQQGTGDAALWRRALAAYEAAWLAALKDLKRGRRQAA